MGQSSFAESFVQSITMTTTMGILGVAILVLAVARGEGSAKLLSRHARQAQTVPDESGDLMARFAALEAEIAANRQLLFEKRCELDRDLVTVPRDGSGAVEQQV